VLVLWYWVADILLARAPDLDPPQGSVFLGVSVVNFDEAVIAAEIDRVQREGLDVN